MKSFELLLCQGCVHMSGTIVLTINVKEHQNEEGQLPLRSPEQR